MSSLEVGPEWVCYVHCNFCNTDLVVSVPCSSLLNVVTVGCGHCANLLSVNMKSLVQPNPLQLQNQNPNPNPSREGSSKDHGSSSSKCSKSSVLDTSESEELPRMLPIRPPEKRQRVPSAYNRFIKEEIQRIKASNPDISHREAFSTAAKNWAHFPHIHFGLMMDGNKRVKVDEGIEGEGTQKTQDLY